MKVDFNKAAQLYEAHCPDGYLKTSFILPHDLQHGFSIPPLTIYFYDVSHPFKFLGRYNEVGENMEFILVGPEHYQYKVNLCVGQRGDEDSWTVTRRGVTMRNSSSFDPRENVNVIFVPKEVCISQDTQISPDVALDQAQQCGFEGARKMTAAILLQLTLNDGKRTFLILTRMTRSSMSFRVTMTASFQLALSVPHDMPKTHGLASYTTAARMY